MCNNVKLRCNSKFTHCHRHRWYRRFIWNFSYFSFLMYRYKYNLNIIFYSSSFTSTARFGRCGEKAQNHSNKLKLQWNVSKYVIETVVSWLTSEQQRAEKKKELLKNSTWVIEKKRKEIAKKRRVAHDISNLMGVERESSSTSIDDKWL